MNLNDQLKLGDELFYKHTAYWYHNVLWSFPWWFGVVCILIAIFVLIKKMDRKRFIPVFICGAFCLNLATSVDAIGIFIPLWAYPYSTTPLYEPLLGVDFYFLPMPCMLLYQKYPRWKPFLIGTILLSLLYSFVFEPLADWLNIYLLLHWKYYYSVPLYVFIFILSKIFADKIERIQLSYNESSYTKYSEITGTE